jgi:3-oxoacyl-(acyl-carrier-protein) synthase
LPRKAKAGIPVWSNDDYPFRRNDILAVRDGVAPPTLNLDEPSRPSVIDRVARVAQERRINCALSNSFGFGGTNVAIVISRFDG